MRSASAADGGVVEVAGTAVRGTGRVVPWRPAQRVRHDRACVDEIHRSERAVDGCPGGRPGALADRSHGVVGERADPRVHRRCAALRQSTEHRGVREEVWHRLLLTDQLGIATCHPVVVHGSQMLDQRGIVHLQQDGVRVRGCVHPGMAGGIEGGQDRVDSSRDLRGRGRHAHPHFAPRVVITRGRRPHHGHLVRHPASMPARGATWQPLVRAGSRAGGCAHATRC
jgi:hypothetical protein